MTIVKEKIFSTEDSQVWLVSGDLGERSSPTRKAVRSELIAEYLQIEPEQLNIEPGPYDKPRFTVRVDAPPIIEDNIEICTSHSQCFMVVALSRSSLVGVDITHLDGELSNQPLIDQFFSTREKENILGLSLDRQHSELGRIWCRKEAVLKCLGLGVQIELAQLDVLDGLVPIQGLPHLDGQPRSVKVTDLTNMKLAPGCQISVAYMDSRFQR